MKSNLGEIHVADKMGRCGVTVLLALGDPTAE